MEKIKLFLESEKGKDIIVVIIVILVGLGSFELGRLSNTSSTSLPTQKGMKIEYIDPNNTENGNMVPTDNTQTILDNQDANLVLSGKTFFASSRGTKYYTISCSAGKTIKQENRIYFTTGEEAETAGYTLSSACN